MAWAPVWLGVLESEWTRVMKAHFDDYGMKFEVARRELQVRRPVAGSKRIDQ